MFKNYIMVAWRNMVKNRLFSLINIFGLAVALAASILILLFVRGETGYDTWIPDHDRIARLHSSFQSPDSDKPLRSVRSPGRWAPALQSYMGEDMESSVRIVSWEVLFTHEGNAYNELIALADPSFFDVFDLPLLYGDRENALRKPLDVILTKTMAERYFGRTNVIGETLSVEINGAMNDVTISGVMADLPENTHLSFQALAFMNEAMLSFAPNILETWGSMNTYSYFKRAPGVTLARTQEHMEAWLNTQSPFVEMLAQRGFDEGDKVTNFVQHSFMPITDLYLGSREAAGNLPDFKTQGDANLVYSLAAVAILVLIVAAINFTNLATARAIQRAQEVAMRKVLGASRAQVAAQFLGEAVSIAVIATMLALVAVEFVLPAFAEVINRPIDLSYGEDWPFLIAVLLGGASVGLLSGLYPAVILSGFLPARILKANKSSDVEGASGLRHFLVVFQFAISIGLIVCTGVVYVQNMYASSLDTGLNPKNTLAVTGLAFADSANTKQMMADRIARIPGVIATALSTEAPSEDWENNSTFRLLSAGNDSEGISLNIHSFGPGFFELYGVKPIVGRTLSRDRPNDNMRPLPEGAPEGTTGKASIVLNQSAVRALGIDTPEAAIGQVVSTRGFGGVIYDLTIVGVVPDIYFRSIKFAVRPTAYYNHPQFTGTINVRYDTDDVSTLVSEIERVWREELPLKPVTVRYVDQMVANMYADDRAQGMLFAAFAFLSIIIACLGLYGLASITVERRTKEIGIRKVMGARVRDIIALLVWQFSKPVGIANLLAWPVTYYFMADWLETFTYRINPGLIVVVALTAGVIAMAIAWITVIGRTLKVAQSNPITALRYE